MVTKTKKKKTTKKRLALPAVWFQNLDEARRNIKSYQKKGKQEVEKIFDKVIDIDFVKKVQKHDVVKRATKMSNEFSKEFETHIKRINKEWDSTLKNVRGYIPFPTRSEVESLSRKVERLSRKVDEITGKRRSVSAN